MAKLHEGEEINQTTARLAVPGGWLYQSMRHNGECWVVDALSFVPDPTAEHVREASGAKLSGDVVDRLRAVMRQMDAAVNMPSNRDAVYAYDDARLDLRAIMGDL